MATIIGTDLSDELVGTDGADEIFGLDGADRLFGVLGDDWLYGGAGNDYLEASQGADSLFGGDGDDWLYTFGPLYGDADADLLDGGAGDDLLVVYSGGLAHTLTGGSGADLFSFQMYGEASWVLNPITITDFNEAEGDRLSITFPYHPAQEDALSGLFRGAAPAGFTGSLGEATPGADYSGSMRQFWTFAKDDKTVLFSDINHNLVVDEQDFWLEFDGTVSVSRSFMHRGGTAGDDVLIGNEYSETLYGFGGNDVIYAGAGSDTIYGGAGDDVIDTGSAEDLPADPNNYIYGDFSYAYGSEGNDSITGGAGQDHLFGGSGNDALFGGDGDDELWADGGAPNADGSDSYDDAAAVNVLTGGAGTDFLHGAAGNDTLDGGDGGDYLEASNGIDHLDGGEGNDTLIFRGDASSVAIASGGSGSDRYDLYGYGGAIEITDFAAGNGGDLIDLGFMLTSSTWSYAANPFDRAFGVFRLAQQGTDTLLQWDRDGAANAHGWDTVAQLSNTDPSTLTVGNFIGSSDISELTIANAGNNAPIPLMGPLYEIATEDAPFTSSLPPNPFFIERDPGDSFTYSATLADGSPLPSWLVFETSTLTFSGTPRNADVGGLSLRVFATDQANASSFIAMDVAVLNTNDAPIAAQPLPSLNTAEDTAFIYTLPPAAFSDVDVGDTLSLQATRADGSALPAWLAFNPGTRTFSGTPANGDVGTLQIRITATDVAGASASSTLTLAVLNVNDAPIALNDSAMTGLNTAVQIAVRANDTDVDGDTLSLSAWSQPANGSVAVDPASGNPVYTPKANWTGSDSFGYTVSDGHGGSTTASVTITVVNLITGTDSANTLNGTTYNDLINGKGGNDRMNGAANSDTLIGGAGNDTIYGGAGTDRIDGGTGNDVLYGGSTKQGDRSADTFVFNTALNAATNKDTIVGFEANALDKIELDSTLFAAIGSGASAGLEASEFRANVGGNALDANDFIVYDTSTGNLYFDADGSGSGAKLLFANLSGPIGTLDSSDFIVGAPA